MRASGLSFSLMYRNRSVAFVSLKLQILGLNLPLNSLLVVCSVSLSGLSFLWPVVGMNKNNYSSLYSGCEWYRHMFRVLAPVWQHKVYFCPH